VKVIKLGGSLLDDASRRAAALRKIVSRWNAGEELVLVHGGGKHIDAALAKLGIAKRTHAGLRVTDTPTLDVVVSVLGGTVNKMLVSELTQLGVRVAGISGCDGATLIAEKHADIDGVDLGHVGQVIGSNRALVNALLTAGTMPVISSVAIGKDGALFNVNADTAATAIAVAHGAKELLFLTDVAGLLDESGAVVPHLTTVGVKAMLSSAAVSGGMKPKLQAALTALTSGVRAISIGEEGGTTLVAA
jgi:acetylglutamate kinase